MTRRSRSWTQRWGIALGVILMGAACRTPEPGEPDAEPRLGAVAERETTRGVRPAVDAAVTDAAADDGPAEGVLADLRWLGGQREQDVVDRLEEAFGPRTGEVDLQTRGREIRFERGAVRVRGGRLVMVRFDLPEAMSRPEALEATGFPPSTGGWRTTHREYRLGRACGFDRFRLGRAPGGSDRVVSVEAWKETWDGR
jgi:hypothetical protein